MQHLPQNNLVPLSEIETQPVHWLLPGYIPYGKITVLEGYPGLGKSTLTVDMAARITRGGEMPDGSVAPPGNVIIFSSEDGTADTIAPRLLAAGGNPDRVFTFKEQFQDFYLPEDIPKLAQLVKTYEAKLVVFDPFSAYVSTQSSTLKEQDTRRIMRPISTIAERNDTAFLLIRHFTKNTSAPAILRGAGSVGIGAAARSVIAVISHPDRPHHRLLVSVKLNIGTPPHPWEFALQDIDGHSRIEWLSQVNLDVEPLLAESSEDRQATRDVKEILLQVLSAGPLNPPKVYDMLKEAGVFVSDRTLRRVAQGVIKREHFGFGAASIYLWYLPQHEGFILYLKKLAKEQGLNAAIIAMVTPPPAMLMPPKE